METILVVDDIDTSRHIIQNMLERIEYNVLLAQKGRDALFIAMQYKGDIHIALTEIFLPDTTGPVVARYMTNIRPTVNVFFMSDLSLSDLLQKGIWIPEQGFLQKPFTENILQNKLHGVLA